MKRNILNMLPFNSFLGLDIQKNGEFLILVNLQTRVFTEYHMTMTSLVAECQMIALNVI